VPTGLLGRRRSARGKAAIAYFLPLQFHDELLEVFPLAQGITSVVFHHVYHVLLALVHSIAEELQRCVAGPGRVARRWSLA